MKGELQDSLTAVEVPLSFLSIAVYLILIFLYSSKKNIPVI